MDSQEMFGSQPTDEQLLAAYPEEAPPKRKNKRRAKKGKANVASPLPKPQQILDNCSNPMITPVSPQQTAEDNAAAERLRQVMEEDGQFVPSLTDSFYLQLTQQPGATTDGIPETQTSDSVISPEEITQANQQLTAQTEQPDIRALVADEMKSYIDQIDKRFEQKMASKVFSLRRLIQKELHVSRTLPRDEVFFSSFEMLEG